MAGDVMVQVQWEQHDAAIKAIDPSLPDVEIEAAINEALKLLRYRVNGGEWREFSDPPTVTVKDGKIAFG